MLNDPYVVDEKLNRVSAENVFVSDNNVVEALLLEPPPRHVPLIAKHPPVRLKPTFDVEVAWPMMFNPLTVVVPKPPNAISNADVDVVAVPATVVDEM